MNRPGYEKKCEMKITRTTHRVTFSLSSRAKDLKDYLKSVPDDARVMEIDDGTSFDDDTPATFPFIEFEVEQAEPNA